MKTVFLAALLSIPASAGQSTRSYAAFCKHIHRLVGDDGTACQGNTKETICCEILSYYGDSRARREIVKQRYQGRCHRYSEKCPKPSKRRPETKTTNRGKGLKSPVSRDEIKSMCRRKRGGCKRQSRKATKQRQAVAKNLADVLKESGRLSSAAAGKEAEEILAGIQEAKQAAIDARGLGDLVDASDDGLYEGDLLLNKEQSEAVKAALAEGDFEIGTPDQVLASPSGRRGKRFIMFMEEIPNKKWRSVVPFVIGSNIGSAIPLPPHMDLKARLKNSTQANLIKTAISEIQRKTCLRFSEKRGAVSGGYIYFQSFFNEDFCGHSELGKQETVNQLLLNFNCDSIYGTIIHNILHSLGVQHEHNRVDRDQFVSIDWKNIDPMRYDLFDGRPFARTYSSYGIPYDYHSVMHYKAKVLIQCAMTCSMGVPLRGRTHPMASPTTTTASCTTKPKY